MIRISKNTRLKAADIIRKAENFFGEEGENLAQKDRTPCCIYFEGGGGFVSITVVEEEQKRIVDVQATEYDYQAKRFMESI